MLPTSLICLCICLFFLLYVAVPIVKILIVMAVSEVKYSCSEDSYDMDDEFELDIHGSKFVTFEAWYSSEKMEKEKQISVDPISLKGSSMGELSFNLMLPPINTPKSIDIPPAKFKFLSHSIPNSATSSPRLSSVTSKKKGKIETQTCSPLACSHVTLLQESFERSKSCGDGRAFAPSDEFDLLMKRRNAVETDNHEEDMFKCGALCLFIPGWGKGKPARARKEDDDVAESVISRTVSLEGFECGSWASSAIVDEDESMNNLYFDLPLELITSNANYDAVNSAFVFDKDRKGVLKNGSTRATGRKSHESPRHVRFSVSSPTSASCISPQLLKAREEFNAFLEAECLVFF